MKPPSPPLPVVRTCFQQYGVIVQLRTIEHVAVRSPEALVRRLRAPKFTFRQTDIQFLQFSGSSCTTATFPCNSLPAHPTTMFWATATWKVFRNGSTSQAASTRRSWRRTISSPLTSQNKSKCFSPRCRSFVTVHIKLRLFLATTRPQRPYHTSSDQPQ